MTLQVKRFRGAQGDTKEVEQQILKGEGNNNPIPEKTEAPQSIKKEEANSTAVVVLEKKEYESNLQEAGKNAVAKKELAERKKKKQKESAPVEPTATLKIPESLKNRLKVVTTMNGEFLQEVVTEVLGKYCEKEEKRIGLKPAGGDHQQASVE